MTTTTRCAHDFIEFDERWVREDDTVIENTGTCEDCGQRIEMVQDWDDAGRSWYMTEIEGE